MKNEQYEQLEFNFKKRPTIKNFFTEHFSPWIGWDEGNEDCNNDKYNNLGNIWKNVVEHVRIGFQFKWKF